ncbi:ferredoxin [Halosimplex salinum]|uniref:ferredoxin n=1 Tax=Halosimplex salinum TaxID=1710538 RepID=UPI000F49540A|nr:ferredoxin [Halosimplex salinum]
MTTEYRVRLDRAACDGVFACLVRDDRFVEADDGFATFDGAVERECDGESAGALVATVDDDRLADAQQAASACPLDAIDVTVVDDA